MSVEFPIAQTCCGQPAFNAGLRSQARPLAEHTIKVFEKTTGDIIIPSGSCTAMLRYGYLELFKDDPQWLARARVLAERVHEFTEYLVDVRGISDLGSRWSGKLTYHPSCHLLRLLGVDRQPRLLLACVRDAEIVELPEREDCCGFRRCLLGGTSRTIGRVPEAQDIEPGEAPPHLPWLSVIPAA